MPTRDLQSYQDHLRFKVAMCCKSWMVFSRETLLGTEIIVSPYTCQSNHCPTCRTQNLHRLRSTLIRTMKHDRWRLVTLTYADHTVPVEQLITQSYSRFKKLMNRVRRRITTLKYIRTLELHKSGIIHHHCVFNRYVPHAFLQQAWKDLGGGIVDIALYARCKVCRRKPPCEHVPHPKQLSYKQAARYLTEEVEKKQQDPHNLGFLLWAHRVRTITVSRNIQLRHSTQSIHYLGRYNSLEDAMLWKDTLEYNPGSTIRKDIGYATTNSAILIGPGYSNNIQPHT